MLHALKKVLPDSARESLRDLFRGKDWFRAMSFSQFGEDVLLKQYFRHQYKGLCVDVGAYQPVSLSNSFYFYLLGWKSINIEPNPEGIAMFNKYRRKDINVQMGVSTTAGSLNYFMFKDKPFENSFSDVQVASRHDDKEAVKVIEVPVDTLENILAKNLKSGEKIDFMSIDVEGLNLEVVKSNNWDKFKPSVVVIEKHLPEEQVKNEEIISIMAAAGYTLDHDIIGSYFFVQPGFHI